MSYKLDVKAQYIKDLSFENPNSPQIFVMMSKATPEINISVNVSSISLPVKADDQKSGTENLSSLYEVTLQVNAEARIQNTVAFICEIKYCGVFSIKSDTENNEIDLSHQEVKDMLLVAAPSILFPFVRELIARATSSSGFPPLMLDIVDFRTMYENQLKQGVGQNDNDNSVDNV
ncbi:preprotein translocase subunit SecB [Ehrlichia ruminantium]|uniref:Protein-export protein SecB n=1 Tax=Ehrlichia ruminantium (strain Gardel) TaxID=302409 RepID=SECB_EHRRG|nr:protein-export chaperone SecB [Ehrlichia ruminantium]Q5FG94.1 RecName: Full=Protein-export protein SecB [Ehrlichia ruminantium str. Gardel]QLK52671.1 protein-export chaperone SecB [Ehrlichia ruminantium]QLK54503.1 protein-export chaperone SecB [Ehrlichia ruminantium]QLK57254.1 protein-export chaperone SecB [Ehrlichia ruminantium]UOD98636.1 protein-export chaperone SecB [Ehrlichia ruminantium]CAI28226.1 Protein-export protein secB [Ehrlichia ruminantium str. Gardel]